MKEVEGVVRQLLMKDLLKIHGYISYRHNALYFFYQHLYIYIISELTLKTVSPPSMLIVFFSGQL